jgi:hypothetical protein
VASRRSLLPPRLQTPRISFSHTFIILLTSLSFAIVLFPFKPPPAPFHRLLTPPLSLSCTTWKSHSLLNIHKHCTSWSHTSLDHAQGGHTVSYHLAPHGTTVVHGHSTTTSLTLTFSQPRRLLSVAPPDFQSVPLPLPASRPSPSWRASTNDPQRFTLRPYGNSG